MAKFKIGDRVRIKDRQDWPSPPGYRLANSEGTVVKWSDWPEVFEEFQEYIHVQIEKNEANYNIGATFMFRADSLEKI